MDIKKVKDKILKNHVLDRPLELARGRVGEWTSPFRIALLAILLFSFFFYNYTNFRNVNWCIHPDSLEAYITGRHFKETGNLTYQVPVNKDLKFELCTPEGAGTINGTVVPQRAYGFYFVCALGFFLGRNGPFYLIPLFGLLCILFFFKTAEMILGEKKALLATFLFALSAPMIYWSSMLYANVPGLAFIIMGLYFLFKIVYKKDDGLKSYVLSAAFLSAGIWLRYENVMIIVLILPLLWFRRKDFELKNLLIGLIVLILCLSPILLINKAVYGDAFSTGYTIKKAAEPAKSASVQEVPADNILSRLTDGIKRIFNRFLTQFVNPRFDTIYTGFKNSIQSIFPVLTLAALFGLIIMFSSGGRDRAVALTFFLIALFWVFYSCTGYLWDAGAQSSILGTSYVRYNLLVFLVFAMLSPLFISSVRNIYGKSGYRTILIFFLVSFLLTQLVFLMSGPFALKYTAEQEALFKDINQTARVLPDDAVMVSSIYAKAIVDRPVLDTFAFMDEREPKEVATGYIEKLLKKGYDVYLIESSWHASYLDLNNYITLKDGISAREIREFKWVSDKKVITDTMYEVTLDPEGP